MNRNLIHSLKSIAMKPTLIQKTLSFLSLLLLLGVYSASAQIQQGNVLVGGDIADFEYNLNKGGNFQMEIDPKAAWFIQDNLALGAYVNFGLATAKEAGTGIDYGVGALARYYVSPKDFDVLKHTRLFFEGNVGIEGSNPAVGSNTNGLGLGVGPGLAYFVTPNIGLEGLLKYNGIVGFGSSATTSKLSLQIGFQIYLPSKKIQSTIQNP